mgnify:CR=1 FL=1
MRIQRSEATDKMILDEIHGDAVMFYYHHLYEYLDFEGFDKDELWTLAHKALKEVLPEDRFESDKLTSILHSLRFSSSFAYDSGDTYEFKKIIVAYLLKNQDDIFSSAVNDYIDEIEFEVHPPTNEVTEAKGEWIA